MTHSLLIHPYPAGLSLKIYSDLLSYFFPNSTPLHFPDLYFFSYWGIFKYWKCYLWLHRNRKRKEEKKGTINSPSTWNFCKLWSRLRHIKGNIDQHQVTPPITCEIHWESWGNHEVMTCVYACSYKHYCSVYLFLKIFCDLDTIPISICIYIDII